MNDKSFSISVILPTLNEADNLKVLIPDISKRIESLNISNYEIIVVDDNSVDDTDGVISNMIQNKYKIKFIKRESKPSLPMSIWEGIENAKYQYVMWLDADGSMAGNSITKIIQASLKNNESVIVGSRFVDGGGYKGTLLNERNSFIRAMLNVQKSKDSVIAMVLSWLFNNLISSISQSSVKDMTSGFIIGKKTYFKKSLFQMSNYGEYFVYLMNYFYRLDIQVLEIGYICGTRLNGVSKTGSSLFQLVKLGIPYIKAARMSSRIDYENL